MRGGRVSSDHLVSGEILKPFDPRIGENGSRLEDKKLPIIAEMILFEPYPQSGMRKRAVASTISKPLRHR